MAKRVQGLLNESKTMLKALFNCTTNIMGGGVKNSAIFIKYALEDNEIKWYFAISPQVNDVISRWGVNDDRVYLFDTSPARSSSARERLKRLSVEVEADVVFTMAGPSYVQFDMHHVMGISNGYLTHADWAGFSMGKTTSRILKDMLIVAYQTYHARRADMILFQTEEARKGFCQRALVAKSKTAVVPNAIDKEFVEYFTDKDISTEDLLDGRVIRIFCPAAAYPHKALHFIPKIARELRKLAGKQYEFKFILSLDTNSKYWRNIALEAQSLDIERCIETIGSYNYADAMSLYEESDIVFVPSILETFTASYIEAFASKTPLVVSDKPFARDICGDAAIYVDPSNPISSAESLHDVFVSQKKREQMCYNGIGILAKYKNQEERYRSLVKIIKEVAQR